MPQAPLSIDDLVTTLKIYESCNKNAEAAARSVGVSSTTFRHRVAEAKRRFPYGLDQAEEVKKRIAWTYPKIITIKEPSSVWVIGSDAHFWPGDEADIWKAFVKICKSLKPTGIVMNGDVIDGAKVSRHPLGNKKAPAVGDEITHAQKMLKQLPNAKHKFWTIGNHDIRVDNFVLNNALQLDGLIQTLPDKFPGWEFSYAVMINETEVRHRFRSGIHGGYNNTLHSGINIITGHTHQLQVTAMRDRRGSRWGVETGMLSDPEYAQFEYTEGHPSRWQQGFVVITFDESGAMFPPELCELVRGVPIFRGKPVL
jgi:hypothetical protein